MTTHYENPGQPQRDRRFRYTTRVSGRTPVYDTTTPRPLSMILRWKNTPDLTREERAAVDGFGIHDDAPYPGRLVGAFGPVGVPGVQPELTTIDDVIDGEPHTYGWEDVQKGDRIRVTRATTDIIVEGIAHHRNAAGWVTKGGVFLGGWADMDLNDAVDDGIELIERTITFEPGTIAIITEDPDDEPRIVRLVADDTWIDLDTADTLPADLAVASMTIVWVPRT